MAELEPQATRPERSAPAVVEELQVAHRDLVDACEGLAQTTQDALQHAHMAALVLDRRRAGEQAERVRIAVARMGRAVGRAAEA